MLPLFLCSYKSHFNLPTYVYVVWKQIPLIKQAIKSSPDPKKIKLFASAWSAPAWMKTNGDLAGAGMLKGYPGSPFYKTWAKYYVR